jgi:hypothetical protein
VPFVNWAVLISVVMAAATAGLAVWTGRRWGLALLGVLLGAIAGVYAGFALVDGRGPAIAIQVPVMFAFIAVSVAGVVISPRILAAGYLLHAAWDAAHQLAWLSVASPDWYAAACIVYDAIVGVFLLMWPREAA